MLHAVGTRNLRLSENRYTGPVTVNFFDARPEGDHAFYASFYGRQSSQGVCGRCLCGLKERQTAKGFPVPVLVANQIRT